MHDHSLRVVSVGKSFRTGIYKYVIVEAENRFIVRNKFTRRKIIPHRTLQISTLDILDLEKHGSDIVNFLSDRQEFP